MLEYSFKFTLPIIHEVLQRNRTSSVRTHTCVHTHTYMRFSMNWRMWSTELKSDDLPRRASAESQAESEGLGTRRVSGAKSESKGRRSPCSSSAVRRRGKLPLSLYCSIRAHSGLGDAHPHWGRATCFTQSTDLNINLSSNTLTHTQQ